MFKILGAKNCRKNLHKHSGPPFQIREGPGSFSNAQDTLASVRYQNGYKPIANKGLFLSYNNMVVGKSFYQFRTIIESALIRLCPKNKYPTKIDFIELKLFKKQPQRRFVGTLL